MNQNYEEIANIIDPVDGASNYLAAQKAKDILKLGYRKGLTVPKVYKLEQMITRLKVIGKFTTTALAREIHRELKSA